MKGDARRKYSGLAMALHWLVAIAVIANWRIAEASEGAATREAASAIMGNHFALGVAIFALVSLRLIWRLVSPPPAPMPNHVPAERALSKGTHLAMYLLLLGMPIAGWVALSSFREGIDVWGLFTVPPLPLPLNEGLAESIFELHAIAGTVLLVLIAVHILATLKHTLLDKDGTLFRMLPFGTVKG